MLSHNTHALTVLPGGWDKGRKVPVAQPGLGFYRHRLRRGGAHHLHRAELLRTSLYLINPSANFPAYYGADAMRRLARRPAAFVAGLATATVAACTPSDSLLECGKRQSPGYDLGERISVFVSKGIGVIGGLVVGFDSDAPEIIRDQYDFATSTPVPTFSVNALMAPPSTPLHERVKREGRLLAELPAPNRGAR